ncbi:MAG: homocysteine S-methyltransferase family protein [Candidatus Lokiarchaeota archaeon]|nr:homocysteine S-methyltransferase family protein [Candidatus Lokiarchaeota archaeon]
MIFNEWLEDDTKTILFDGGMGSEIIKRGLKPGKLPDLLNIEEPQVIRSIQQAYYEAGSEMVQSNTFGSCYLNLKNHNLEEQIVEINQKALEIINSIRPINHLIVGDIGPSSVFKPPIGDASIDMWQSSFKKQVEILNSGVDLWHIETISDIDEMTAAIRAIKEVSSKPIISSMTYKKTKRGFFTIMGDSLEKCLDIQMNEGADVVGANCTLGSNEMIDLMKEFKDLTDMPVSIKPNAGKPRLEGTTTIYDQTVQEFTQDIIKIINLGAKIVGGCCGTTPHTIQEIKKKMK